MEYFIETLIYLLAILGIIFTSISFYEMFDLNKYINNTYRIYSNNSLDSKKVEIIVKLYGIDEVEEESIVNVLKDDDKIKNISNKIIIEREE